METKTVWRLQPVLAELYPSIIWTVEGGHWMGYTLYQGQMGVIALLHFFATWICTSGIFSRRYLCCKACDTGRLTVWFPGVTPFWNLALAVVLLSHTCISPCILFHTGRSAFAGEKPGWKYFKTFSQTLKIKRGGNKPKPAWERTENGSLCSSCMGVL